MAAVWVVVIERGKGPLITGRHDCHMAVIGEHYDIYVYMSLPAYVKKHCGSNRWRVCPSLVPAAQGYS